jgi:calcineurin-like phosphoesterase family protein
MTTKNTWFTSDLHVDHKNIIQYCNRPWTFENQREEIITRWNSRVGVMDKVYHLGDFVFAGSKGLQKTLDIINELNGVITFIKGNHCQDNLWKMIEQANLPHVEEICHYKEITIANTKIVMCHYPFETWNKAHHGAWHLHGHCHGSLPPRGKRLDCGIDNHPDRQVFSYDEIKAHMDKQEFVINDHHTGERG